MLNFADTAKPSLTEVLDALISEDTSADWDQWILQRVSKNQIKTIKQRMAMGGTEEEMRGDLYIEEFQ